MSILNGIAIIPTGLGANFGGDAGFNSGAKLLASCCENLIINPNFVNASDINEMPDNCWYTEGSIIDSFLEGQFKLKKPKTKNKILMVANSPLLPDSVNAKNAGVWGLGAEIELVELEKPLIMKAIINSDGSAGGEFSGADELINQIKDFNFDVLAIHTPIQCDEDVAKKYWNGIIKTNPWGQVEAQVSKYIASKLGKNIAHAPIEGQTNPELLDLNHTKIVNMTMAPEIISKSFCFCVLKGLHKAPRISQDGLSVSDIDFLVTPHGCWGRSHIACNEKNIPIIVVKNNTTVYSDNFEYSNISNMIFVENYLEACGVIMSMNASVDYRLLV